MTATAADAFFAAAEAGARVREEAYEAALPGLREALLDAQYDLGSSRRFPLVILVSGLDAAGKRETIGLLNTWMDPRHIRTIGIDAPTDEERQRPRLWRFWRALPPAGRTAIFSGSWYHEPLFARVHRDLRRAPFLAELGRIRAFEALLAQEGTLLLKFWMHLPEAEQRARLERLSADPLTAWRVTPRDWEHLRLARRVRRVAHETLAATSTAEAPWRLVEATDPRHQALTVGRTILETLRARLDAPPAPAAPAPAPIVPPSEPPPSLRALDLAARLDGKRYRRELERWQGELARLARHKRLRRRSVVVVFEGVDAAGKGGTIRRLADALDARQYEIHPIGAPTEAERAHPWLWRFWTRLPRHGRFAVFDRSWYGRVLVERVEGFCAPADWQRAYDEINEFEAEFAGHGAVLAKFWLHISQAEQLRRFEERAETRFKRFKITDEDWRNRAKWPQYEAAVGEMLARTSTAAAPWHAVASEDKQAGRVEVLRTLCAHLEEALGA